MANLTVRNLTIHPLELATVERFEAESVSTGNVFTNLAANVTGFLDAQNSSTEQIVAKGNARHKDDVHAKIEPFKAHKTNIRTADPGKEVIRLRFKTEDHDYEIDIPTKNGASSTMKKINGGPHELTAVYVPTGAFLAVFSSAKLNAWMKELHNDWPLPLLSIPGTHNSPTHHKALPSVRCQAVSVQEQLDNGVRFLDIRVSAEPDNDELTLVHAVFPISLTGSKPFSGLLDDVYAFLDRNPSETVLTSLKREGTGKGTDQQLSKYLKNSYVEKKKERWYTEPRIPKLGEARGKIVLMRRFGLDGAVAKEWHGKGWGIDASAWPDNCEDGKCCGDNIRVQDFYEVSETENIQKKIDFARGALERASSQIFWLAGMAGYKKEEKTPPFFVNFLSASNFFDARCWPERIAAKINPSIVEYLCIRHGEEGQGPKKLKVGDAGTGIVVTDWVGFNDDWDLVRCVVGMNARLQVKR